MGGKGGGNPGIEEGEKSPGDRRTKGVSDYLGGGSGKIF